MIKSTTNQRPATMPKQREKLEMAGKPKKRGKYTFHGWAKPDDPVYQTGYIIGSRTLMPSSKKAGPESEKIASGELFDKPLETKESENG